MAILPSTSTMCVHQRQGIGRALLQAMLAHGRTLGCTEVWVATEQENAAARGLYRETGSTPEDVVLYSFPLEPQAEGRRGG